jgi:hypothetical protein
MHYIYFRPLNKIVVDSNIQIKIWNRFEHTILEISSTPVPFHIRNTEGLKPRVSKPLSFWALVLIRLIIEKMILRADFLTQNILVLFLMRFEVFFCNLKII